MINYLLGGALLLIVIAILWKMVRDRKSGKNRCCGDCSRCGGCR